MLIVIAGAIILFPNHRFLTGTRHFVSEKAREKTRTIVPSAVFCVIVVERTRQDIWSRIVRVEQGRALCRLG